MAFKTTRRIEFCETDMAGIVHFAEFYRYMEQAEHDFRRSLGLSIFETEDDGAVVSWPRVSAACSFLAPARYEDELEIDVRVASLGAKSAAFAFEMRLGATLVARGEMKSVCCRIRPGQPLESIAIPPATREKLRAGMTGEE